MHVVIEKDELIKDQITSRKNGQVFYVAEQPALMFVDHSEYPFHFKLRLAFEDSQQARDSVGPVAKGKYMLADSAFAVSRFGELALQITPKHLKPYSVSSAVNIPRSSAA
ncbi:MULTISPECIES: single-stranded DNA-binding protein [Methylomonas]|uniref:Uncharacterized protein n=1 Tax=Methylomonas koyamae TaxID=702114 RepID=A0A177NPG0_9GAMM|nr:single-stranded DNA-binding protein [Methylomonas koyamae]OAI19978.1 hypothetical protein A1355_03260 [Methylomonas koyamae]